ncbi:MAG TPA: hypothetical protein VNX25_04335 [Verrucomicrobiae bacterium]|nr:hypothetical protein [Verrucomicrobiae bacterium]
MTHEEADHYRESFIPLPKCLSERRAAADSGAASPAVRRAG